MRNFELEIKSRVEFIQNLLKESHADGIVFGNSGGKDSALVGILCKMACDNTVGIRMPCHSKRNFGEDLEDAGELAKQFEIEMRTTDLTDVRAAMIEAAGEGYEFNRQALANIAPRLRMTYLYAIAAAENRLVAGTGNRSERYMGYFTKWGDGACDFNPIGDLTVGEIYDFLRYLNAPANIIEKAPSGGLFDGQTDESEMGVSYAAIDRFILTGEAEEKEREIIERYHSRSGHKMRMPPVYGD